ncbi:ribokinase [Bailinhaonella thermotolerans]|uniref:Ribokinase n=1 Tax=Bailinhaonella thermotolerans TaxID=1070861 RepID=A0A3A4BPF3_9ACTN|nr:ribokinase [Bailinhaonella thermotolerans]
MVGIGALNLDYIADVSAATGGVVARISRVVERSGPPLEWGTERWVDEQTIHSAIEEVSSAQPVTALGGSAFNAIYAIARSGVGLRLGYVGVAGRVPVIGVSSVQQLESFGVDHRFVERVDDRLCGICFSVGEDGDRTLLTHAGANDDMADHIDRRFGELVDYLGRARVVHVTSFLDDRTAGRLLALLRAVKRTSPGTLISFDPGHVWSADGGPEVAGLVRLSDFLLVNYREFRELGGHVPGEPDERVAGRLLDGFDDEGAVVIVKRPTGISAYRRGEGGDVTAEFYPQSPLPAEEIEDATGAGDVFAAGLLIALACDRMQVELGSLLGMRLARHKLRYVGSAGHAQFAQVTREFIGRLDRERRSDPAKGVFIAHGANPEWRAVQRFIEERFELPVFSFESGSWGGRQVTEALAAYLERCSLAVCVLTAEDFTGDGRRLARQNVVHEVGLFHGRHGFDRVVVLAEEGCDFIPQTARPHVIPFPRNGIDRTFYRLAEMIRGHGFPHAGES